VYHYSGNNFLFFRLTRIIFLLCYLHLYANSSADGKPLLSRLVTSEKVLAGGERLQVGAAESWGMTDYRVGTLLS